MLLHMIEHRRASRRKGGVFVRFTTASILWVPLLLSCGPIGRVPAGPNVLLVTIDTLRADHVGAYGAARSETPTLDGLAARGVLFETAIASAPLTLPSHATILTGLYPPSHGARHNGIHRVDESVETMAELFRAGGWSTGAVVGATVLNSEFGLSQGFDVYDDALETGVGAGGIRYPERKASEVTDRAINWLATVGDRPFLLWVHYYDPHAPYAPPEPQRARFGDRPYDGEVAYVDQELGRLLDSLRASGTLDDTVVAVTSDHGEGLGDHGETTHAYFVYETVLRVPLILAGPGIPHGVVVPGVTSLASVAGTLETLAGLSPSANRDGPELTGTWQPALGGVGAQTAQGWAYAEGMASQFDHGWSPLYAIRTAAHHFIRAPREELYEVETDPDQLVNTFGANPAAIEAGRRADARIDEIHARTRAPSLASIDATTRAEIEALGYVVPGGEVKESGADPKDVHHLAELYYAMSRHYLAGRYDEALAEGTKGLSTLNDSPALHDMLGRIWAAKDQPERGLPHAEIAARQVPESPTYALRLGHLRRATGDIESAVEIYRRVVALWPENADARTASVWRCRVGETEAAREDARVALARGGSAARRFEVIGGIWESCGAYAEALEVYRAGVARHGDNERLQMGLAIQWARLGELAESEAARERAGSIGRDPDLCSRLAVAHAIAGNFEQAERVLRDVLREHPDHPMAGRFLAHLLSSTGSPP